MKKKTNRKLKWQLIRLLCLVLSFIAILWLTSSMKTRVTMLMNEDIMDIIKSITGIAVLIATGSIFLAALVFGHKPMLIGWATSWITFVAIVNIVGLAETLVIGIFTGIIVGYILKITIKDWNKPIILPPHN